jgi:uncharacterized DUF497 family protein
MKDLSFDWDQWNIQNNEVKHGISRLEAESAFFDKEAAIFQVCFMTGIWKRR